MGGRRRAPGETARRLLVHDNHMTAMLKAAHGQDVALDVLEHRRQGHTYRRKILLTVDQGKRFVEFGIVRLNLECVAEEVRDAILNRRTPLGAILGKHNVLTHVEPKWFLRFPSESPILQYLNSSRREAFGRLGMIYCDGEPAVELLEVVPD